MQIDPAPAAPAAAVDHRPRSGYFLDEDTFHTLERAAAAVEVLSALGEYAERTGTTPNLSGPAVVALADYLHTDLKATVDGCRWGQWAPRGEVRRG